MTDEYDHGQAESNSPRTPPHSIEAEQSVLGSLMLDDRAWEDVSELLLDTDFYRHDHRLIFRAIMHLVEQEQPIDVVTVAEELEERSQLDKAGGASYLSRLVDMTPSIDNCAAYAEIVRERSQQRALIEAASEIMDRAYEPDGKLTDADFRCGKSHRSDRRRQSQRRWPAESRTDSEEYPGAA